METKEKSMATAVVPLFRIILLTQNEIQVLKLSFPTLVGIFLVPYQYSQSTEKSDGGRISHSTVSNMRASEPQSHTLLLTLNVVNISVAVKVFYSNYL